MAQKKPSENTAQPPKKKFSVARVIFFIFVFLLAFGAVRVITDAVSGLIRNSSSSSSTPEMVPYVSSEFGFSVEFPGVPSVDQQNETVDGSNIPFIQYTKEFDNGRKAYLAQGATYSQEDFDVAGNERSMLEGAITGMAEVEGYSLISSSNDGVFLSYPSADATFNYSKAGKDYTVYTKSFIKENQLFSLMSIGETEAAYDRFISTFKFI